MADRIVELRLSEDGAEKFFRAELSGVELTTTSGKVGAKGRTTQKKLKSVAEAAKAFDKAVLAKKKDGYFPEEEGYGDPFDLDASGVPERVASLQVKPAPKSPRGNPPIQLDKRRSALGWAYADGPGEWGLWSPGRLKVGRRNDLVDVEPELAGKLEYTVYPHVFSGFAHRPDGDGVLLVREDKLLEIDLPSARAEVRHTFSDAKAAAATYPAYGPDPQTVLWRAERSLVMLPPDGAPQPVFEAPKPIVAFAPLHAGRVAVLTIDACFVLGPDFAPTHEMPVRAGTSVGSWLDGRILVVSMNVPNDPRATVFLAVDDDGGLHELHQTTRVFREAFDLRDCQWMTQGDSYFRVYNADLCYAAAVETPAVARDHVLNLAPLHDYIAEARNAKPPTVSPVAAALKAVPARREARAYNQRWTPLGYAAGWFGDLAITKVLVEAGADLDAFDSTGRSPLAGALEKGHLEVADYLIAQGAKGSFDAKTATVEGKEVAIEAPLVAAARRGLQLQLEALLEAGADIEATGHDGATALAAALLARHPSVAKVLLARGARTDSLAAAKGAVECGDVAIARQIIPGNEAVRTGDTGKLLRGALLNLSVATTPREIIDLLVEAGARDDTAEGLHRAVDAKHAPAVKAILAAGVDANTPYVIANGPNLPLTFCFFRKDPDLDVAAALLDGGADIEAIDNRRLNALNYAAANAPLEVVTWLLDRGASTARGGAVWTPLLQAINNGRLDVMERLVARGADLKECCANDDFGPVALAIQKQKPEAMEWLLERGPSVNVGRFTPLMAAALANDVALLERLLGLGADPTPAASNPFDRDKTERTAQAHAEAKSCAEAAAFLAQAGGGFTTLHPAIEADDLETVARMLDEGADIEAAGARGMHPLHVAATRSLPMVELLLARGADPNASNEHGTTVLMEAAGCRAEGAASRVRALLEAGADPKVRVSNGVSALERAVSARNLGVVRLLLDAGAPVENKAKRIYQPVHLAAQNDDVEMLELLMTKKPRLEPITVDYNGGQRTPLHLAAESNATAAIDWLIGQGADQGNVGEWKNKDDYDEVYWNEGERTPLHLAAEAGAFAALVALLRHDRTGERYRETANHKSLEDLAENNPRILQLLTFLDETDDVDAALARLREAEGATTAADAAGDFWIERITEEVREGTSRAGEAVRAAMGPHDWVRTQPVDGAASLVLRFDGGLYRVAVGDGRGVFDLATEIRAQRVPYSIHPDGRTFLVSDRTRAFVVGLAADAEPTVREVASDLEGEVTEVGFLADGATFVVAGGSFARYEAADGPVAATWKVPAADVRQAFGTGSDTVGFVFGANVLQVVWARADADGLRFHGTLEDSARLVWTFRDGDALTGYAYSSWYGPRIYRLHHIDGVPAAGEPMTELPPREVLGTLPPVPVRGGA